MCSDDCDLKPSPLIHISARRRIPLADTGKEWDGNFAGAVRHSLAAHFDPATQPIALGGVFVVTSGKINMHTMVSALATWICCQFSTRAIPICLRAH